MMENSKTASITKLCCKEMHNRFQCNRVPMERRNLQTQLIQDPIKNISLSAKNTEKEQSGNSREQQEPRKCKEKEQQEERSHTTVANQDLGLMEEFISLRTVPAVVSNGKVKMTVNALLDDASTKTYINSDVGKQLKLKGI